MKRINFILVCIMILVALTACDGTSPEEQALIDSIHDDISETNEAADTIDEIIKEINED